MIKYRTHIIIGLFVVCFAVLALMDPIPQPQEYHDFADQRNIWGISNFWNVISNLPMGIMGVWGMAMSFKNWKSRPEYVAKWIPVVLCIGIIGACFGSAYYHWTPDSDTLVWDRLPMTLMFMPLFALLIYDFIGKKAGEWAFWVLIPLGIFSIFYWQYTESIHQGDLRLYAFVQFGPIIMAPFIIWLFPKNVDYKKLFIYIIGWYVMAKLCEHYDEGLYNITGFWSGHTIKHLLGGVSLYYVVKVLMAWEEQWVK